ncbi:hypothetical protein ACHAXS_012172 [Conticribra weissflogii]
MPELPEVENFRQILLPLVVCRQEMALSPQRITIQCPSPVPPKSFPSQDVIDSINNGGYVVINVLRKGKVICMVLQKLLSRRRDDATTNLQKKNIGGKNNAKKPSAKRKLSPEDANEKNVNKSITGDEQGLLLSLHMGMTGRISSPGNIPGLESLSDKDTYPPPHTHMILSRDIGDSGKIEAAFSDPRRFGSVSVHVIENLDMAGGKDVSDQIPEFEELAEDALQASKTYCEQRGCDDCERGKQPRIAENLTNQRKGIKALLLDQRAVVSGVGNWVADEILYRSGIHPDQTFLTIVESDRVIQEMNYVLSTAVDCLNARKDFPKEWLFHRRWRSGGSAGTIKDFHGKNISFLQSGGRSSAVVLGIQKKKARTNGRMEKSGKQVKEMQVNKIMRKNILIPMVC